MFSVMFLEMFHQNEEEEDMESRKQGAQHREGKKIKRKIPKKM